MAKSKKILFKIRFNENSDRFEQLVTVQYDPKREVPYNVCQIHSNRIITKGINRAEPLSNVWPYNIAHARMIINQSYQSRIGLQLKTPVWCPKDLEFVMTQDYQNDVNCYRFWMLQAMDDGDHNAVYQMSLLSPPERPDFTFSGSVATRPQ